MKRLVLLFLICFSTNAYAYDFKNWETLLERYVSPSNIHGISLNVLDYASMRKDPEFQSLLDDLKKFSPKSLKTESEKKSFWINVYNIFAIKVILENYPVESIRDIGSLFKPVWSRKAGVVGGENYTLDRIEHGILRKMGDPRVHTAIVCASVSCPDLRREVYLPSKLSEQLDTSMKNFLVNPKKGFLIDKKEKVVYLSSIFDWFKKDFEGEYGGVVQFVQQYLKPEQVKFLQSDGYDIEYLDYDWDLNTLNPVSP